MKLFRAKYPSLLRVLYPGRISKIPSSNSIFLTFDDGPVPEVTPWVLELLKKHDIKATFFCIGDNVKKHPDLFQKILAEGHTVCNHTFNHLQGWKTSNSEYLENTLKAEKIMSEKGKEVMGQRGNKTPNSELRTPNYSLFRPPYGRIKNSQAKILRKQGYKIVMWDVVSGDYDQDFSAEECYENVVKNAGAGSTIVFHDSVKAFPNLEKVLPRIIEYYKEKGFDFRSLKAVL